MYGIASRFRFKIGSETNVKYGMLVCVMMGDWISEMLSAWHKVNGHACGISARQAGKD